MKKSKIFYIEIFGEKPLRYLQKYINLGTDEGKQECDESSFGAYCW